MEMNYLIDHILPNRLCAIGEAVCWVLKTKMDDQVNKNDNLCAGLRNHFLLLCVAVGVHKYPASRLLVDRRTRNEYRRLNFGAITLLH